MFFEVFKLAKNNIHEYRRSFYYFERHGQQRGRNPICEQDGGFRTPSKSLNLERGTPMFSVSLSALQHFSEPNWSTECHADYSCGASFLEALRLCDAEMEMTPECSRKSRDYGTTPTYTGKKIYNNLSNPDFSCGKKILI